MIVLVVGEAQSKMPRRIESRSDENEQKADANDKLTPNLTTWGTHVLLISYKLKTKQ